MTELIQKAINKIDSEAEKLNDTNVTLVASHIIDTYLTSEVNAEKVLDEKKTLEKCINNIKSKAKQQATNGMAMIDDETVYGWAKEYYGFAVDCKENKRLFALAAAERLQKDMLGIHEKICMQMRRNSRLINRVH